jgi:ABC-type transport system involved in cytochrome bd biosynthesis fused ATPase/permease subunit
VTVQYGRTERQGLKKLDVTLKKGERMAVVGPSGAGKSTMIHLLLGFMAPTSGRILLDDAPLATADITAWRKQCAWIGQHPMLFTGSLRENMAMARPGATDAQIEAAARQAGVMEFAAGWTMGLDTLVGEQGLGLSAGQAQRVALARAFIKDAPLLLLDEPTASLDKATEAEILADMDRWSRDRTVLIATHRPAALALAHRIVVLKNGELAAQGDYETLKQTHWHLLPKHKTLNTKH